MDTVAHLPGPRAGPQVAQALARGGGRTEVLVNGPVLDYLNRRVESNSAEPRRLRVSVPRESLQAGENVVELRQTLDRDTGLHADAGSGSEFVFRCKAPSALLHWMSLDS